MAEQQEFCLRWNDFHSNFHLSLEALRGDESFTDVTLSCSGRLMKAHRVILSACSVHFKEILRGIPPQQHPVIVLPTVDYDVMQAIMEFIYQGQVNVKQSQLGAFLQVAETFSIQGLADDETKKNANKTPGRPRPPDSEPPAAKRRRPEPSLPRPGSPAAAAPPPASTAAAGSAAEAPVRAQPTADSEKTVNISVSIKAEGMADTMVGELLEHSQPGGQMMDPDMEAAGSDVVAQAMATMGHESADTSASAAAPAVLSDIWEHFWTVGEHEALCRTCHCTIRYHRSSISNLKRHLVRRHPESFASDASATATAADAPATAPAAATAPAFSWPWPAAEGKSESGWPPESV